MDSHAEHALAWRNLYDGFWFKANGEFICEIRNRRLLFNDSEIPLQEVLPGTLLLRVNETDFVGHVSLHAQAAITWSKGEVWLRK